MKVLATKLSTIALSVTLTAGCINGHEAVSGSKMDGSGESSGALEKVERSTCGDTSDAAVGLGQSGEPTDPPPSVAHACDLLQGIVLAETPMWPIWVSPAAQRQLTTWNPEQRIEFAAGLGEGLRFIRPNVRIMSLEDYPIFYSRTANSEGVDYYCYWGIGEDIHLVEVGTQPASASRGQPVWTEPPLPRTHRKK